MTDALFSAIVWLLVIVWIVCRMSQERAYQKRQAERWRNEAEHWRKRALDEEAFSSRVVLTVAEEATNGKRINRYKHN